MAPGVSTTFNGYACKILSTWHSSCGHRSPIASIFTIDMVELPYFFGDAEIRILDTADTSSRWYPSLRCNKHLYNCYIDTLEKLKASIDEKSKPLSLAYSGIFIGVSAFALLAVLVIIRELTA